MLETIAQRNIRVGDLTIIYPSGRVGRYGDGVGAPICVQLKSRAALLRLVLAPSLALGECYMDGSLIMQTGQIYDLMDLLGRNFAYDRRRFRPHSTLKKIWFWLLRRVRQFNDRVAARRNVRHHYDISNALYRRFLDPDMQYSCAYFSRPGMTLEQAQAAKKAHIAAKLLLEPGHKVLDIGCGWGGMGLSLAEWAPGSEVLGVTLSAQQLAVARERAEAARAAVRFELCDYRDVVGPFDRIVSVGMFEHVGAPHYQEYFDTVARLLKDDGIGLIHAIGRRDEPGVTNPWIAKYIFPGGYIPALSEVLPMIERAGLWVTDIEVLRLHYAQTLRLWRERFLAQRAEIAQEYDERFCRMFEFYFSVSEIAFRYAGHMVFQIQVAKTVDAAPITRDYMGDESWPGAEKTPCLSAVNG